MLNPACMHILVIHRGNRRPWFTALKAAKRSTQERAGFTASVVDIRIMSVDLLLWKLDWVASRRFFERKADIKTFVDTLVLERYQWSLLYRCNGWWEVSSVLQMFDFINISVAFYNPVHSKLTWQENKIKTKNWWSERLKTTDTSSHRGHHGNRRNYEYLCLEG